MSKRRKLPLQDRRPGFDLAPASALAQTEEMLRRVALLEAHGDPTRMAIAAEWRATFEGLPAEGVTQFRAGRRVGLELAITALTDAAVGVELVDTPTA